LELDKKNKPRFFGPLVVVHRTFRGSYTLAELDGSVGRLNYAAFRLVPYHARRKASVPIAEILDKYKKDKEDRALDEPPPPKSKEPDDARDVDSEPDNTDDSDGSDDDDDPPAKSGRVLRKR
jgi:hypothetical protein